MAVPQKKPWSKPTLKKIEVTEEVLQLFRSKRSITDDLDSIMERRVNRASR